VAIPVIRRVREERRARIRDRDEVAAGAWAYGRVMSERSGAERGDLDGRAALLATETRLLWLSDPLAWSINRSSVVSRTVENCRANPSNRSRASLRRRRCRPCPEGARRQAVSRVAFTSLQGRNSAVISPARRATRAWRPRPRAGLLGPRRERTPTYPAARPAMQRDRRRAAATGT
jgi:hypothetical protein